MPTVRRHERNGARDDEGQQRGEPVFPRLPFELRQSVRFAPPFIGANREEVADSHRDAVGGQVGGANHDHGQLRQLAAGDTAHDRKSGDDAVVGPVDEIADVVASRRLGAVWFDVERGGSHA
jgi:hypothetical protein